MGEILAAAIDYAERGWIVHRIHPPTATVNSPGKQPVDARWQKVTTPPTEAKLTEWFGNGNQKAYNIGLLCGEASGVTVIDLDRMLYADIFNGVETLRSSRTSVRGHIYFKYNPHLPASKHHNLGIEVLSTGNNVILAPSVHASGDLYRWDDPAAPLAEMSTETEMKLKNLFKREKDLVSLVAKCRPCFKRLFKKEIREATDFHGAEGRELMLAWGADLKAAGATLADGEMWAKIIYGDGFDKAKTVTEWRNIDEAKTWKCSTVADKLGGMIRCDCAGCAWKAPTAPKGGITFKVINNAVFASLRNLCKDIELEEILINGEAAFRCVNKEFVDSCVSSKAGELITDESTRIILHPEEIIPLIEKVEEYKGESGVLFIYIGGRRNEFTRKEIHTPAKWMDILFDCGYGAVISQNSNRDKKGFAALKLHIANVSEVKWTDTTTQRESNATRFMEEVWKLVEADAVSKFIGSKIARHSTVRNGEKVVYVNSATIEEIKMRIGLRNVPLSQISIMLADHLAMNATNIDTHCTNARVWVFKPLEGGDGVGVSK